MDVNGLRLATEDPEIGNGKSALVHSPHSADAQTIRLRHSIRATANALVFLLAVQNCH